jgi:hypothetical protein
MPSQEPPQATSRCRVNAMKVHEPGPRSLTPQDVRDIVGDLDDAKIAALLATGANAEQLEEAMAWASGERRHGDLGVPSQAWWPSCDILMTGEELPESGLGGGRGSRSQRSPGSRPMAEPARRRRWTSASPVGLDGILGLPRPAGVSFCSHGSGSGRFSPRNNYVAAALRRAGLATLLFDLLTEDEAADRRNVFDIELLAERHAGHGLNPTAGGYKRCRSVISAPAPVPRRRWSPQPGRRRTSAQSSRGAGVPIWLARCSAKCERRRSSLWAETIPASSS